MKKHSKKTFKNKAQLFVIDFIRMIIAILHFISKYFWQIFFIVLFIFLVSKYMNWNNQRMQNISDYWDKQEEVCGQVAYYSETGERADCQPVNL